MSFSENETYWKLVSAMLNCYTERELERIYFTMNMKDSWRTYSGDKYTKLTTTEYNALVNQMENTTGLSNPPNEGMVCWKCKGTAYLWEQEENWNSTYVCYCNKCSADF